MADSWTKDDNELGMLPVNALAERKLGKIKMIKYFAIQTQVTKH